ncbi:MAG: hypothetical protein RL264_3070 [Bacteroidota bacterium]|jgi:hypothetical protein
MKAQFHVINASQKDKSVYDEFEKSSTFLVIDLTPIIVIVALVVIVLISLYIYRRKKIR